MTDLRDLRRSLSETQRIRLDSALQELGDIHSRSSASGASVIVADAIPVNHEDNVLKGHGTSELNGEVVATLCGVVERVNKLVYVRNLRGRYKPEIGDIIIGRVIEVTQKRWKLEINFSQDAVLILSSMNLPDGIQRRRTATDELNMRSIFEENDVICAEVRGFQHDGSLHLQARSQKYGKLEKGQMLTVPTHLVKRRKQHFHHLKQYQVDLILGCNGFIWVGEHMETGIKSTDEAGDTETGERESIKSSTTLEDLEKYTPLETRRNICRIANAIRVLSGLGFILSVELIIDTVEWSASSALDIKDMLGAEFFVQLAEREVQRRMSSTKKKR